MFHSLFNWLEKNETINNTLSAVKRVIKNEKNLRNLSYLNCMYSFNNILVILNNFKEFWEIIKNNF